MHATAAGGRGGKGAALQAHEVPQGPAVTHTQRTASAHYSLSLRTNLSAFITTVVITRDDVWRRRFYIMFNIAKLMVV